MRARESAGLQQLEVAAALRVSRGTVRRWERGYYLPAAKLRQLSELYRVPEFTLAGPSPVSSASIHDSPPEWPQWAREMWASLQLDLVRAGCSEQDVEHLKGFVLAPELLSRHTPADLLRLDVEAGIAAARAWVAARYPERAAR